jgi:hypothetical protein
MAANRFFLVLTAIALVGCARFDEKHYFATINPVTQRPVNYFRLTIKGDVSTTNMRYVSGFYDERAVELFLNETKATMIDSTKLDGVPVPPVFPGMDCTGKTDDKCAARLSLVPLGSKAENNGAFVMIMSTNADSIASTIGAFAEQQQNVTSAIYLLNSQLFRDVKKLKALETIDSDNRKLALAQIDAQFVVADEAKTPAANEQAYLGILGSLAATIDPAAPGFAKFEDASSWFASRPTRGTQP